MNRRLALRIGLVASLLVALLALWASRYLERVEEEVDLGYRGAARTNPYLAMGRLLARLGVPSPTAHPGTLPPIDHVLLLLGARRPMTRDRATDVLRWVASGGRLVAVAATADGTDALLAELGVGVTRVAAEAASETVDVAAPGQPSAPIRVAVSPRLVDERRDAARTAGSAKGLVLVRKRHGLGVATILSDAAFLTNARIGEEAHAAVAWYLVAGEGKLPAGAWIVHRDATPSLWSLLFQHARAAIAAGALLLALLLWRGAARFGPPLPDPPVARRSLREHLDASSAWLYRHGQAVTLVEAVRESFRRRLEVREPAWARLPRKDLVKRLAGRAGVPLARLDRALHEPVGDDPVSFVTTVQTIEAVRRSL